MIAPAPEVVPDRPPVATESFSPVVELRQYTLHKGRRDALIELFEREFVESQEACGMQLIGQFRDLDDADRFVWLRGFRSMPARAQALAAFYGGPVWNSHRSAANATMLDSDNVLLLRPALRHGAFMLAAARNGSGLVPPPAALVVAIVHPLREDALDGFDDWFMRAIAPLLTRGGALLRARLVSEHAANTFPALPVREGENVHIAFLGFEGAQHHALHQAVLARTPEWRAVAADLRDRLRSDPQVLRLSPTRRSRLRG